MEAKKYSYNNQQIKVSFDSSKCINSKYCFKELNSVFSNGNKSIDLSGAPVEEIIIIVKKCPSGALSYERLDGFED
jgi:uncharacterized Fe-S cluster protein YjdI